MPSTPLTCSSIGAATVSRTVRDWPRDRAPSLAPSAASRRDTAPSASVNTATPPPARRRRRSPWRRSDDRQRNVQSRQVVSRRCCLRALAESAESVQRQAQARIRRCNAKPHQHEQLPTPAPTANPAGRDESTFELAQQKAERPPRKSAGRRRADPTRRPGRQNSRDSLSPGSHRKIPASGRCRTE